MATRRRLDIEIGAESKGDGFDRAAKDADRLGDKLRGVGPDAERGFRDVEGAADRLGDKLRAAGSSAADKLGSGLSSAMGSVSGALSDGLDVSSIGDGLADSIGGLGGRLGPVAAVAGAAIGGALAVGLNEAMEREVATDRLAAQLGGGDWAESMGEIAGNLYADAFGDSVGDVATTLRQVLQAGLLPEDATNAQIEAMTAKVLTFGDVLEQDTQMAVQAVSNMIRTGIARDGAEAFDVLTRGIEKGGDRAEDLLETFQEYSTMFRDVGLSAGDAMGLIVQGLEAGARDADTVADALKEFAIRAQDGSETSARGFERIGLSASEMTAAVAAGGPAARDALDKVLDGLRNMTDPTERNAAAVELFGTKAEDLGDALFNLDVDSATAGLGNVRGATDQLGGAYDNASTKIEAFRREALGKLAEFVANSVIPRLESFSQWAKDNPGAFQAMAVAVGLLALAFLALGIAMAIAAIAALPITLPMALIAAGIVLIILLIVLLIVHWDKVKAVAGQVLGWIGNRTIWLKDVVVRAFTTAKDWIAARVGDIVSFVTGIPGRAGDIGVRIAQKITGGIGAAKDWVSDRVSDIVDLITGIPRRIGDIGARIARKITGGLGGIASSIGGLLGFDVGGVVPGPVGEPMLAVVHGGETIFPTHDPAAMRSIAAGYRLDPPAAAAGRAGPGAAAGGGTVVVVDVTVQGSLVHERDLDRVIADSVNRSLRTTRQINVAASAVRQ